MNGRVPLLPTGLVAEPVYREHVPGPRHPECPERYDAVVEGIRAAVPPERLLRIRPRPATEDELALCHSRGYIEQVKADVRDPVGCLSTGDTDVCGRSYDVALFAAGGVLAAVDAVMDGSVRNAFCAVRPPGHHASADVGMGFCIFNNIAIAARYVQRRYGLERMAIVDWDVHHGNGTQDIFLEDASVFYASVHEWPLYPGTGMAAHTGAGAGVGATLNCPAPKGAGRTEIVERAIAARIVPALRRFRPQFLLISAGFDGRAGDPLGHWMLTDADFAEMTRLVMDVAQETAAGRIVSALEGGYGLAGLASAVGAHVHELATPAPPRAAS